MRKKLTLIFILFFLISILSFSEKFDPRKNKTIKAYRVVNEKIKIDGKLTEKVWQNKGRDDFVQSTPIDGGKPSERTVVWVAYDKKNLYVAARLYDSDPKKIVKRTGTRDSDTDSDEFILSIDPYNDKRSGYLFKVNPANSILDGALYNDSNRDDSWDGVWESAVKIDSKGWTVEIKIPFNQLNFKSDKKEMIWGINFERVIKRKNEKVSFIWIPRSDTGFVSHFAKLIGLRDIKPGIYTELLPYIVGKTDFYPKEEGNPFKTGNDFSGNMGLDAKINLKSNLTLNLTFNPDFGQVEVDPAVMNLTAYETYFEEKRPFFVEGASIFDFGRGGTHFNININWTPPEFFYSRRIGRPPQGYAYAEYSRYPDRTTILGASKLTGKIGNNWNIGIISALTAREFADTYTDNTEGSQEVEPMSFYGIIRLLKEFDKGKKGIGFIGTGVLRDFDDNNLMGILNKRSFSFGVDGWSYFGKDDNWVASGWFGASIIEGSPERLYYVQLSPQHYFQRPDADYLTLDPSATSLEGWAGRLTVNKEKGNWFVLSSIGAISPGFDVSDSGFQRETDIINGHMFFGYKNFKPGKILRSFYTAGGIHYSYDFGGDKLNNGFFGMFNGTFLNYWGIGFNLGFFNKGLSKTSTRGGPLMMHPSGEFLSFSLFSDRRKAIVFMPRISYMGSKDGGDNLMIGGFFKWKPRTTFTLSVGPHLSFGTDKSQWVTSIKDSYMTETYGKRYIFSSIDTKILSFQIRLSWVFSPKLSFTMFLQPFIAVGDYYGLKELKEPKTYDFNVYGEGGSTIKFSDNLYIIDPDGEGPAGEFSIYNPDFNYKSVRGTAVLKWEFKTGSNFYLVWTQNRSSYANTGIFDISNDFNDLINAKGTNIFLAKISYRWGF